MAFTPVRPSPFRPRRCRARPARGSWAPLDGYRTYDATEGHGDAAEWQRVFGPGHDFGTEISVLKHVSKALSEATKEVEEAKEAAAALGLGAGSPGSNDPWAIAAHFKRTAALPRVRKVLGILHGLGPESVLDVGSGRGVFLCPLLDGIPLAAGHRPRPQRTQGRASPGRGRQRRDSETCTGSTPMSWGRHSLDAKPGAC